MPVGKIPCQMGAVVFVFKSCQVEIVYIYTYKMTYVYIYIYTVSWQIDCVHGCKCGASPHDTVLTFCEVLFSSAAWHCQ